ncbi:hypothetical protein WR25_10125 [Diploscapter pachys]|uniref:Ubiquinol-cytochrome-c reductase complex assembly factor 2 n=1 Tax=Diploscapter pachys TaxID=2018661 RepID=A0A2A2LED1_9BILA|nr:hypothetical protein WR25_10125 [Diploscapter pachys]
MISRYLYKQYIRLLTDWPKDMAKGADNDLSTFLVTQVERAFRQEQELDNNLCEKKYQALKRIASDDVNKAYPHSYKSGVFGLNLEQLQEVNSLAVRKQIGLTRSESIFKRIGNFIFPKKTLDVQPG